MLHKTSTFSIFIVFAVSAILSLITIILIENGNPQPIIVIVGAGSFSTALVFGVWFLWRLPSAIKKITKEILGMSPSYKAILFTSLTLLGCIICASPKEYRIQTGTQTQTEVVVKPIWDTHPISETYYSEVRFIGLNYSILLCEIIGSIAFGLIIWALGKNRKNYPRV
ncbi:MAG: hypothetical protein Q6367_005085 [Candidatus Freyarchaeota archaeon]